MSNYCDFTITARGPLDDRQSLKHQWDGMMATGTTKSGETYTYLDPSEHYPALAEKHDLPYYDDHLHGSFMEEWEWGDLDIQPNSVDRIRTNIRDERLVIEATQNRGAPIVLVEALSERFPSLTIDLDFTVGHERVERWMFEAGEGQCMDCYLVGFGEPDMVYVRDGKQIRDFPQTTWQEGVRVADLHALDDDN